jgi:hypothetical protein
VKSLPRENTRAEGIGKFLEFAQFLRILSNAACGRTVPT